MPSHIDLSGRKIALYLSAGFATAPNFMADLKDALITGIEQRGGQARAELLFPYGDWSRTPLRQLWEIRGDLGKWRNPNNPGRARLLGARRLLEWIVRKREDEELWLIGHSAGGMAAVQAAAILESESRLAAARIVLIGSPKVRVPDSLQSRTLALYAVDGTGKAADPVARYGSWGGWGGKRLPRWLKDRWKPIQLIGIPVQGGHPDYFRTAPLANHPERKSNLEVTLGAIWSWLGESEKGSLHL